MDSEKKLITCLLEVKQYVDSKEELTKISAEGYYKKNSEIIEIYFANNNNKYKYIILSDDHIQIRCNESFYDFILGKESISKIVSNGYELELKSITSYIEINENNIIINYELWQDNFKIGKYNTNLQYFSK